MSITDIFDEVKSGVAHIIISRQGQRLSSGTGFLCRNKLITCAHVLVGFRPDDTVTVRFSYPNNAQSTSNMSFAEVMRKRVGFSDEHSFDFVILDIPGLSQDRYGFEFSSSDPKIGEQVLMLGYPFEHNNLTLHQGYISSRYVSGVAEILQLDMSVNPSNSGGPLINIGDGRVYGVVARKATGLSDAFDKLLDSFRLNMEALQRARGVVYQHIEGVEPLALQAQAQDQMRRVALEIRRSANVGIGYCIRADTLQDEAALHR